jgi:hypothetical protein
MVNFEAEFDIGDIVQHYITKEQYVIRFVVFALDGTSYTVYSRYSASSNNYTFGEAELEPITGE